MIEHLEPLLDRWALWSVTQSESLGHATQSPIKKMMEESAPTSKKTYRQRRHYMILGEGWNSRKVPRDLEPMRCVGTRGKMVPRLEIDPVCEMVGKAYEDLRLDVYREALRLKYISGYTNDRSAKEMGVGLGRFKGYIDLAHESVDTFLRHNYGKKYDEILGDYITMKIIDRAMAKARGA